MKESGRKTVCYNTSRGWTLVVAHRDTTLLYCSPLTLPPRMAVLTFWTKTSRFLTISWAASDDHMLAAAYVEVRCSRTLVQRIIGIRLEEEVLQPDHDGVQVEHRLPVFSQDVQADVPIEVNIRMVDL